MTVDGKPRQHVAQQARRAESKQQQRDGGGRDARHLPQIRLDERERAEVGGDREDRGRIGHPQRAIAQHPGERRAADRALGPDRRQRGGHQ
ncbi:hypothetical protein [Burkholderia ubonensis]|uniref:hypothetical protein n=1 Tax=Burkholderia ubonensis TaxID=101571 RepID=UPI0012FA565C|nr:hypothetical protein [Burkholderia ubonensis]